MREGYDDRARASASDTALSRCQHFAQQDGCNLRPRELEVETPGKGWGSGAKWLEMMYNGVPVSRKPVHDEQSHHNCIRSSKRDLKELQHPTECISPTPYHR